MKKITFLLIGCLLSYSSFSQWNAQASPTTNVLNSVYFTDANNGWAVTSSTEIFNTSNAGVNWSLVATAGASLYSVSFGSGSKGCVVGAGGAIKYTTNLGATWLTVSPVTSNALSSVIFINADTVYAVGNGGTIIKSINGGVNWQIKTSGIPNDLKSICFTSPTTGYAVGFAGKIIKTTNVGTSWTAQTSGTTYDLFSVNFSNATTGYACGNNGTILKTTDAGSTWTPLSSGTTNHLSSIYFDKTNPNIGYAVGDAQTILKTTDAGTTWYTQTPVTSDNLYSVFFTDANNGYTVGAFGKILKTTNGGCATPTVSISGTNTICAGNSTTLTSIGAATYVWTNGTTNSSITISPTATSTYTVTGTTLDGCSNSSSSTVTVNPLPILTSTLTPSPVCSNTAFNYTATSSPTGATITWSRAVVTGISNAAATGTGDVGETLINTTSDPIIVTYVYTTVSNGCSNVENVPVTIKPTPTLNSGLTATVCSDIVFNYTPTSLTSGSIFSWTRAEVTGISNQGGSGGDDPNEELYDTISSPVTVNYNYVIQANSCSNSENLVVTVNPVPIVTNATYNSSCSGTNPNITLTANLASTFSWTLGENSGFITGGSDSSGPILNQILTNIDHTMAYDFQYQVYGSTISGGCLSYSYPIFITVNPTPISSAGSDGTICSGSSLTIGGSPTAIDGTGPYTYSWVPASDLSNPAASNPIANPTSTTSFTVTVTDSLGCIALDTAIVTVNSVIVNAGADISICAGQNTTLTASGNASSYSWDNGITNGTSFTPTHDTIYVLTGTLNGCSQTDTVQVTINAIPTVNAGADVTVCAGQNTALTASGNASVYTWDNGITNGVSFTPSYDTMYVVTGTSNGCSQNDTVSVTVDSLPVVNAGADISICSGVSTTLTATGNASIYTWDNGVTDGIGFTPTNDTIYVLTGTKNGCSQNDTVQLAINPLPIVIANSSSSTVCFGDSLILYGSGTSTSYVWSDGVIDGVGFAAGAISSFMVTGTDGNNCSNMATISFLINPLPAANAGADQTICHGDTAILVGGTGGTTYSWTDGITAYNTQTVLVNPNTSTSYTLTVTGSLGCMAYDTAIVNVTASKDIYGHVSYSLGDVTNGTVVLYKYVQFQTRFDTVQVQPLNSAGNYLFNNINHGDYLIKVFVDSAAYPELINTYYGGDFLWNGGSVIVINHTCNINDTANITMVELPNSIGGPGLIIGRIIEGLNFGRNEGEPIPGVDIKLGKNPGGIIARTQTNTGGYYTFSGVAFGNYTIYVDIPGLGRDSSYTFDVDSINNQFLHQDYIADSTSIYVNPTSSVGINNPTTIFENKFIVYPNPVKGNTTIEYNILQVTEEKTTLEVYNILGVKIITLVDANQQTGLYKYAFNPENYNLNSGVYFITLTIDGKVKIKRIVVMD